MKGFGALREIRGCQTINGEMEGFTQAIRKKEENFVLVDRIKVIARIIAIDRGDEILSEIELQVMEL